MSVGLILVVVVSIYGASLILSANQASSNSSVKTIPTSRSISSESQSSFTITETAGSKTGEFECPAGQNATSYSNQGLTLLGCFPTSAHLGDEVVLNAVLRDDASVGTVYVGGADITVRDSAGELAYQADCAPSQIAALTVGRVYECTGGWNTAAPYNGIAVSDGTFLVHVSSYGLTANANITISG